MNWSPTRLRYIADLNPHVRSDLLQETMREVSFLPMEAVGEDGSLDLSRVRRVADVRNGYSYFEDGDVAIAKVTPCFENGKGAIMRDLDGGAGFGTTELTVLRPRAGVDARFLRYFLASAQFMADATGAMTGAGGLKRVPDWFIRDYPARWPDTSTQENIANFLDDQTARIDALIAEKERLVERIQEYWRSIVAYETGAVEAAPGWKAIALKRVTLARCDGPFGSGLTSAHYVEQGARVVRLQNIKFAEFDGTDTAFVDSEYFTSELSYHNVLPGDVLVAGLGDERNFVGRACVAPDFGGDALVKADCFRFRLDCTQALPEFVALQLSARAELDAGELSSGSTRQRIPLTLMQSRMVWLPELSGQKGIVRGLQVAKGKVDELLAHAELHIERLREYRSSLISAAVTGQLDVGATAESQRLAA